MTITQIFFDAWWASKAISTKRYDRLLYCKEQLLKVEDCLNKYFDGSNKKLWAWMQEQLN